MKLAFILLTFITSSFAVTGQYQNDVLNILDKAVYYGDIEAYHDLQFVGVNANDLETYKLTYSYVIYGKGSYNHGGQDIDEIVGSEKKCEYIVYSTVESDFLFTGLDCSVDISKALGTSSEFSNSEAEISEVLQTDSTFSFILDYEVPEHIQTIVDDLKGNIEIYKLEYVDNDNNVKCEYITFDPEIDYLKFTGVTCDRSVEDVIDENLREN
jgi:hypothetical protein